MELCQRFEVTPPDVDSRWHRIIAGQSGMRLGYTILFITNTAHDSKEHPPQVVYQGDNGNLWSLPLDKWPGSLRRGDK